MNWNYSRLEIITYWCSHFHTINVVSIYACILNWLRLTCIKIPHPANVEWFWDAICIPLQSEPVHHTTIGFQGGSYQIISKQLHYSQKQLLEQINNTECHFESSKKFSMVLSPINGSDILPTIFDFRQKRSALDKKTVCNRAQNVQ